MDRAVLVYKVDDTVTEKRFKGHRVSIQIRADGRAFVKVYRKDGSVKSVFLATDASSVHVHR